MQFWKEYIPPVAQYNFKETANRGGHFSDLPSDVQDSIKSLAINVHILEGLDNKEVYELFFLLHPGSRQFSMP